MEEMVSSLRKWGLHVSHILPAQCPWIDLKKRVSATWENPRLLAALQEPQPACGNIPGRIFAGADRSWCCRMAGTEGDVPPAAGAQEGQAAASLFSWLFDRP